MTEKALREGYQATPCLGYRAVGEGKPFAVEEKSYAIVEYIFQTYHSGKDMTATARAAQCQRIPDPPRATYSTAGGINRILANRFYIGEVIWNGYSFQGTHEVRSSVTSLFDDVQKRIEKQYRPQKRRGGFQQCPLAFRSAQMQHMRRQLGYNRSNDQKKRPDFFQCWSMQRGCIRVPAAWPYTWRKKL